MASFDEKGHFVLEGDLTQNATSGQLTPVASDLMVWKDSSSDCVARITSSGDMYIEGTITEKESSLTAPAGSPFVMNDASSAVAYIDGSGNLKTETRIFIGEDPDRSSSQGK